ncbi:MAG: tetratricopeptide repeat protein [Candidatus Competibacteraceae bacterium]|nr:tetratricopeptide repeat protein [Candidatus Competibacteraceae bacterium]
MRQIILSAIILACTIKLYAQETSRSANYMQMAIEKYKSMDAHAALDLLNKAIEVDPLNHEAFFWRALMKRKTDGAAAAISDYDKAISLFPDPKYYNNRGVDKALMGMYQSAISDYYQALRLKPDYGDAMFNMGYSFYELGVSDSTCHYLQMAANLNHDMATRIMKEVCKEGSSDSN